ncbi:MAG: hypothetical protein KA746_03335 [Pyrinomonadaceae bacterium]|nr:hypothetical protein [Pyrinomonadaceae bacterium]MBP6213171.1 hypothetical protein [Pyrinomonadaceae bacterium]
MAKERNLKTALISALIGTILGTLAAAIFFYGLSQPGNKANVPPPNEPAQSAPAPPQ